MFLRRTIRKTPRIEVLDGLRCLAILWVIAFHYFSRFAERGYYPYGDILSLPPFSIGHYGVQLFFLISGFVICLTLHKSKSIGEFALRRFARLWPAMVLCATLTFLYLTAFPLFFQTSLHNFLPSLTFTSPEFWRSFLPTKLMDGAYWSLIVEVQFYLLAAFLYFTAQRHFAKTFLFFTISAVATFLGLNLIGQGALAQHVDAILIPQHLPWFTIGMGFYFLQVQAFRKAEAFILTGMALIGLLATTQADHLLLLMGLSLPIGFYACLTSPTLQCILGNRLFAAIGLSSYSLYLLHQNIGVTAIRQLSKLTGLTGPASLIFPVLITLAFMGLAHLIYTRWERPLNTIILSIRLPRFTASGFRTTSG